MTGSPPLRVTWGIWRHGRDVTTNGLRLVSFALAAALPVAAAAAAAAAVDGLGSVERGAAIAARWCSNCHVAEGKGSDAVPSLASAARRWEEGALRVFLAAPHGAMPDLSLESQEIDDLIAYMAMLKTN